MIEFYSASSKKDLLAIEELACIIWREHYIPMVGREQVEYMLDKFQSAESMKEQIEEGSFYYILKLEEQYIGYLSFRIQSETLFLSKIYILSQYREKKFGKSAMVFVEQKGKERGCSEVSLTVNKNNINSIKAYEKIGFLNLGSYITDIGSGFIMDDYKLHKQL